MTRRRWVILLLAVALAVSGVALLLLDRTAEPTVDGRKLSAWVSDLHPWRPPPASVVRPRPLTAAQARALASQVAAPAARPVFRDHARVDAAIKAIRKTGTNAIPHLLPSIYVRDGKFKTWSMKWLRKQNVIKMRTDEERRGQALTALSILGPDALWTWVEIVTNAVSDPEVQVYAAVRISSFGQEATPALPVLLSMSNHREPRAWAAINWAIMQCDRKGVLASIHNLRHPSDADLRASAAWSLGFIGNFPDITVPALVLALRDTSPRVREEAVNALAKYGTNAVAATPVIRQLMSDNDRRVREAATVALERVVAVHKGFASP